MKTKLIIYLSTEFKIILYDQMQMTRQEELNFLAKSELEVNQFIFVESLISEVSFLINIINNVFKFPYNVFDVMSGLGVM